MTPDPTPRPTVTLDLTPVEFGLVAVAVSTLLTVVRRAPDLSPGTPADPTERAEHEVSIVRMRDVLQGHAAEADLGPDPEAETALGPIQGDDLIR